MNTTIGILEDKVVKAIQFDSTPSPFVELCILSSVDHPNVIKFLGADYEVILVKLFMEKAQNNLFDVIRDRTYKFTYSQATIIARSMIEGVGYLHRNGFVHADISTTNFLINLDPFWVKLSDFGRSFYGHIERGCCEVYYNVHFRAPEMWCEPHSELRDFRKADVWALGKCISSLLLRKLPVKHSSADSYSTYAQVFGGPLTEQSLSLEECERMLFGKSKNPRLDQVKEWARSFLKFNPEDRPDLEEFCEIKGTWKKASKKYIPDESFTKTITEIALKNSRHKDLNDDIIYRIVLICSKISVKLREQGEKLSDVKDLVNYITAMIFEYYGKVYDGPIIRFSPNHAELIFEVMKDKDFFTFG